MAKDKLLVLTPDMKQFTANGVEYFIESSISERRWINYQQLQIELAFSLTFEEMFKMLREAYDLLNKQKFADAAVRIYNLMESIKKVAEQDIPPIIAMCALFINTADEDRRIITKEMIEKKRQDWFEEGIDMNSFFLFAINSIPGFIHVYKEISRSTSNQQSEI
jgi:hypothetical protein